MSGSRLKLLPVLCLLFTACGGSSSSGGGENPSEVAGASLRGEITSAISGDLVQGAEVIAASQQAVTDQEGRYQLDGLPPGGALQVSALAEGHAPQYRTMHALPASGAVLDMPLVPLGYQGSFQQPGELMLEVGGAQVSLSEDAVLQSAAGGVPDWVSVSLAVLAPASNPAVMPGEYRVEDATGVMRPLESFGGLFMRFTDSSGAPLQWVDGAGAAVSIPVSTAGPGDNLAEVLPLLFFDEQTFRWRVEGTATLEGDAPHQVYVGDVSRTGFWQVGDPYGTVNVRGCVRDPWGEPVVGDIFVRADGLSYVGGAQVSGNASGRFAVPVRRDATATVTAFAYKPDTWQAVSSVPVQVLTTHVDQDLGDCLMLDLDAEPPQARISVEPAAVTFGAVLLDETQDAQIIVRSTGRVALEIDSLSIVGLDAGRFALLSDTCSEQTLAPDETCALSVRFAPEREGDHQAVLPIFSSAPQGATPVPLTGRGHVEPAPQASFSPSAMDFGTVAPGGTRRRALTVSNLGTAPLNIISLQVTGVQSSAFAADAGCVGEVVAPGDDCVIDIDFSPAERAAKGALLTVASDDPEYPHQGIELSGIGGYLDSALLPDLAALPLASFTSSDDAAIVLAFVSGFVEEPAVDEDDADEGLAAGAAARTALASTESCMYGGQRVALPDELRDVDSPFTSVPMAVQTVHWQACDEGIHVGEYFIDGYEESASVLEGDGAIEYLQDGAGPDAPLFMAYADGFMHKASSVIHSRWDAEGDEEHFTYALEASGTEEDYLRLQRGSGVATGNMFREQLSGWPGDMNFRARLISGDWGMTWSRAQGECPLGRVTVSTLEPLQVEGDDEEWVTLAGKIAVSAGGSSATGEIAGESMAVSLNNGPEAVYTREDIQALLSALCLENDAAPDDDATP
ncbi:MAG: choice-of-anchor D domain-containing protein [Alcanivorax sp.]|nr:choice-of-anchor D domain-containing protein [Alcanivorax sp.]